MRVYYSGQSSKDAIPEHLLVEQTPDIMFTFHDFWKGKLTPRMKRYLKHHTTWRKKGKANAKDKSRRAS